MRQRRVRLPANKEKKRTKKSCSPDEQFVHPLQSPSRTPETPFKKSGRDVKGDEAGNQGHGCGGEQKEEAVAILTSQTSVPTVKVTMKARPLIIRSQECESFRWLCKRPSKHLCLVCVARALCVCRDGA